MQFPDYAGGSLLNLMRNLGDGLGLPPRSAAYAPLRPEFGLSCGTLAGARQILLIVVDGLGDELLTRHAPDGALARHRVGRLTSVFPSTTASAIPTFLTGLAPAAHGLTGWHMWFAEIQRILAVLPMSPRGERPADWPPADLAARLFSPVSMAADLGQRMTVVSPREIIDSPCNRHHTPGARRIGYQRLDGFLAALVEATEAPPSAGPPRLIHAYYPDLDNQMHRLGTADPQVAAHVAALDLYLGRLIGLLAGSGTRIILTADHGFIDAPAERLIELDAHPELAALLARPLCGERRIAYAYVRPDCHGAFAAYVAAHLGHACRAIPTAEFIATGWFGPGPHHPDLASRAGDFVLLMQEDWTIKDWLPGEKHYDQPGVHGGCSAAEMFVPLIVAGP